MGFERKVKLGFNAWANKVCGSSVIGKILDKYSSCPFIILHSVANWVFHHEATLSGVNPGSFWIFSFPNFSSNCSRPAAQPLLKSIAFLRATWILNSLTGKSSIIRGIIKSESPSFFATPSARWSSWSGPGLWFEVREST